MEILFTDTAPLPFSGILGRHNCYINLCDIFLHIADFDECRFKTSNCDENADCSNSDGSFECTCNYGFAGDGTFCYNESMASCMMWIIFLRFIMQL